MNTQLFHKMKSLIFDRPFQPGIIIQERYEIIHTLGMGSYGITYLVNDHKEDIQCVLKQIKPSRKKTDSVLASFESERKILSYLNHPQIPKLAESFCFNGDYFFTMDYINGRTFEDLIFNDGFVYNEPEAFTILREILEIVSSIHVNKIVHRDLRIPNIMQKEGQIYIVDFGLARFIQDHHDEQLNMTGYDIEKRLKREVNFNSDFYALGHFILFLLYSSFTPSSKKERSWEEELNISNNARLIIRRLLQNDEPYNIVQKVMDDIDHLLMHEKKNDYPYYNRYNLKKLEV